MSVRPERGQTRYRLRADAFFVKSADGVWLRNNRGSFSIGGASAYPLVKHLFARLEKEASLDEISRGADLAVRNAVEGVLGKLEEYGFVRRVGDPPDEIPEWASALYGDQLRFIDHHGDRAFDRFLAFRNQRIVCRGNAALMPAVLVALVEYGAADVTICPGDDGDGRALAALAAAAAQRDPGVSIRLAETGGDRDVTIWLAGSVRDLAAQLDRSGGQDGIQAAIVRLGAQLVVSPPLSEASEVCLECAHRALGPDPVAAPADPLPVGAATASLAAQQLVYDLFAHAVSVPTDEGPLLRAIDGHTLAIAAHRLHPHPLCRRHAGPLPARRMPLVRGGDRSGGVLRPDVPSAVDTAELVSVQDAITTLLGGWSGALAGPLLRAEEGDLPQLPLAASECAVREVRPELGRAERALVCCGLSTRETRNQAVLFALEWLAGELLDLRALSPAPGCAAAACGVGWSVDEAAYRGLVHFSMTAAAGLTGDSNGCESAAFDTGPGRFLRSLLADHAPGPVRHSVALAPTGLYVATAETQGGRSGRGAGATDDNAVLNALMDLAVRIVGGAIDVRPALLTTGLTSWRAALAGSRARSVPAGRPNLWELDGLLPFARHQVHVVAVDSSDGR